MFSHTQSLETQAEKINKVENEGLKELDEAKEVKDSGKVNDFKHPDDVEDSKDCNKTETSREGGDDLVHLLAEAEKRGFMRAMTMRAEELFNRPTAGTHAFPESDTEESAASDVIVLSHMRRSVWD